MKTEYGKIINRLEIKLSTISDDKQSIEGLLNTGIDRLKQLNFAYTNATLAEARDIIGLIYPENFTFRNNQFQTARVSEIASRIYLINSKLKSKKNGTKEDISSLSREVTLTGLQLYKNTFLLTPLFWLINLYKINNNSTLQIYCFLFSLQ